MKMTTSGVEDAISSQVTLIDGVPGRPSTASPPASSIIPGTQWPPLNGGSDHSSAKVRGLSLPATAATTARSLSRRRSTKEAARNAAPVTAPTSATREHLLEGARIHRENLSVTPHHVESFVDVSGGHRADGAEVLGQHQIRLKISHCLCIQAIDRFAVAETRTHQLVHLSRIGCRREGGEGNRWLLPCSRWPIALVGHSHQAVLEAEGIDDLGGRGQEGQDAHPTIVPQRQPSRYLLRS